MILIIPLIPVLVGAAVSCISVLGLIAAVSHDSASLLILGMKQSGKTRWLKFLRNEEYIEGQTWDREKYSEFTLERSAGETIKIKSGYDYAGTEENVKTYYENAFDDLKGKSVVMFFFNMYKYINNENENEKGETIAYKRAVVARLGFIERQMTNKNIDKGQFYLVMTYSDKVKEDNLDIKKETVGIISELRGEDLGELIGNNYFAIDATDENQLNNLKNTLEL